MTNAIEIVVKVDDKTAAGAAAVDRTLLAITASAKAVNASIAAMGKSLVSAFDSKVGASINGMVDGLDKVSRNTRRANDSLSSTQRRLRDINSSGDGAFDAIGDGAARMSSAVVEAAVGAGSAMTQFGTSLAGAGASAAAAGGGMTVATGGLNLVVGALLAAAAAAAATAAGFVALGPGLLAIGGFAGAAMSALGGLAVAIATVKIGLGGIGGALAAHGQATGGGGGGGGGGDGGAAVKQQEAAAQAIRAASRALRDAKREEIEASKAVNRARQDEIERLQDLDLALRGQRISQREAKQSLVEAEEKNRRAQQAGSAWEKTEAANAVERAKYQYDSVTEKLGDLTAEKRKAAKVGVEGSDQVQKALENERRAHERTSLAAESLANAQKSVGTSAGGGGGGAAGGINAFNEAMKKLSPNARELVHALIDIQKRFEPIKRAVQDRFLDGWAESSTRLYDQWEDHLLPILGKMADRFNLFGKAVMRSLGDSTFIKNIEKASDSFGEFFNGKATTAFIDSFGRIAAASTPALEKISDLIDRIFVKFNKWIKAADDSGALDTFMEDAAKNLELIAQISSNVIGVIMDIIEILFPTSKTAGKGILESVNEGLKKLSDWLNDPENQSSIREAVDDMEKYGKTIWGVAKTIGRLIGWLDRARKTVTGWSSAVGRAGMSALRAMGSAMAGIIRAGERLGDWFRKLPGRLRGPLSRTWDGLADGFRNTINWIVDRWNRLSFQLPTIMGGGTIGMPQMPRFASGGVTGQGWAEINERGKEMVRLPTGSLVMPHSNTQNAMMNSGNDRTTTLVLKSSGNRMDDLLIELLRGRISAEGGNVQLVLGRG